MTNNKHQLKILREITSLTTEIPLWLRGGWAIDFLLRKVTREHSDIDLLTWVQHREQVENILVKAGFNKCPISELQTNFYKDDVEVSIVFLMTLKDGRILANGIPEWEWRRDALLEDLIHFEDISINILNPLQLLEEKKVYEQGTGRKPREKDLQSIKIIEEIIKAGI